MAARVDMARTICRRTERVVVSLSQLTDLEQFKIVDLATLIAFLNRLSDYLFSLRCFLNSLAGYRETEFVVD